MHVVTNSRFAPDFRDWALSKDGVTVHDDGTSVERGPARRDRRRRLHARARRDRRRRPRRSPGDNLFDYPLEDFVAFWRGKGVASAVAVLDVGDLRLASQYGIVDVAERRARSSSFVEKPVRSGEHARRDRDLHLRARARPARRAVSRRRQRARPDRQLHRVAARARAGLRVPVRRLVARHRRQGAAARRRQPAAPGEQGSARALRVPAPDLVNRHDLVTLLVTDARRSVEGVLLDVLLPTRCAACDAARTCALLRTVATR